MTLTPPMPTSAQLRAAVDDACITLRTNVPAGGRYWGGFSGGKDSTVIRSLATEAGVPVDWWHCQTTIDAPETVHFLRSLPDVQWRPPPHGNFFHRMVARGVVPTRRTRWCCAEYKENTPAGVTLILGIRARESKRREASWTRCVMDIPARHQTAVLPIRMWSEGLVWAYIRDRGMPYNPIYDEGFTRTGCVGCPLSSGNQRRREFARWPGFERAWKLAFRRMWAERVGTVSPRTGRPWWGATQGRRTWTDLWDWWMRS